MGADWLNALEDVGGRLVPAARDFLLSQLPPLPGKGPSGVRWLADLLEDFVDRESDGAEDDRFVEGAGAFLGVLLIDHLGGGAQERDGCHRVQLGRFGCFDPFGAIHEALDAEDPRKCLSAYLLVAEREARDEGPISRVVRIFAEELSRARPDLTIDSQFELTVDLDSGASIDLAGLERAARDQDDDDASQAARRIISMLPGAQARETTPWSEAAPRLLPRLVSRRFVDSLPAEQDLYLDVIGHDVLLALQLRYGARARYLRRAEVDEWDCDPESIRERAIANLAAKSRNLRLEPISDGILRVRQSDGLDGARLLLPDLAARLERLRPGGWLASAPHRDVLLLAREATCSELSKRARDAAQRAPHPVSASLFLVTPDGPRPLQP